MRAFPGLPASALAAVIRRATWLFLGLPAAVFLVGWLRPTLAWPAVALLGWALYRVGWNRAPSGSRAATPGMRVSVGALCVGGLLPALVLVGLSGAGGWGSGDNDWFKHDTILHDLIERPWPVAYATSAGPVVLVYYVCFYLPAALVGKWTGSWFAAQQTLALTVLAGTLLALGWLWLLGGRTRLGWWRAAGMLFLFSGMDVVGQIGMNLRLGLPPGYGFWNDLEWWAQLFQYPANAAALFWAPHQALGAWLPTALLLDGWLPVAGGEGRDEGTPPWGERWLLPLGLSVLWSPLATVGLAPVVAGMLVFQRAGRVARQLLKPANMAGVVVGLAGAAYYSARLEPFRLPAALEIVPGRMPAPLLDQAGVSFGALYLAFVLLEFVLLAAAVAWSMRRGTGAPGERLLLALTVGTLLVLPCCHYGYFNDLVMRAGLPALFALQVLALRMFHDRARRRWAAVAVAVAVLAVGTVNASYEYRRHLARMVHVGAWRDDANRLPVRSLFWLQREIYNLAGFDFARQYLGANDGFYARRLAPADRPAPREVAE